MCSVSSLYLYVSGSELSSPPSHLSPSSIAYTLLSKTHMQSLLSHTRLSLSLSLSLSFTHTHTRSTETASLSLSLRYTQRYYVKTVNMDDWWGRGSDRGHRKVRLLVAEDGRVPPLHWRRRGGESDGGGGWKCVLHWEFSCMGMRVVNVCMHTHTHTHTHIHTFLPSLAVFLFEHTHTHWGSNGDTPASDRSSIPSPSGIQNLNPTMASSPNLATPNKPQQKQLRFLNINFHSVKKKGKQLEAITDATKPDIILGAETWLDPNIRSAEIFPDYLGYVVRRRDLEKEKSGVEYLLLQSQTWSWPTSSNHKTSSSSAGPSHSQKQRNST